MNPIKLFKVDKANAVYIPAGVFLCGRCGTVFPPIVGITGASPRKRAEDCCVVRLPRREKGADE